MLCRRFWPITFTDCKLQRCVVQEIGALLCRTTPCAPRQAHPITGLKNICWASLKVLQCASTTSSMSSE